MSIGLYDVHNYSFVLYSLDLSATEDKPMIMIRGIMDIFHNERKRNELVPDRKLFIQDQNFMFDLINDGPL